MSTHVGAPLGEHGNEDVGRVQVVRPQVNGSVVQVGGEKAKSRQFGVTRRLLVERPGDANQFFTRAPRISAMYADRIDPVAAI